jgi:transposase
MAGEGRPKALLLLTDEEPDTLGRWARTPTSARRWRRGAAIVLSCAQGLSNQPLAVTEWVRQVTVGKWRACFERRIDGLHDESRPGGPRAISDDEVERVITKTLRGDAAVRDALVDALDGQKATGMSQSVVTMIWRVFRAQAAPAR